jgi:dTMP kinase
MSQVDRLPELNRPDRATRVYEHVVELVKSPSHGQHHIDETLTWVKTLSEDLTKKGYQLEDEFLCVATICHDLGRTDPGKHKEKSIELSIILTREILSEFGYQEEEIKKICDVIEDHDRFGPAKSLEGQVLREADYLAGFGASGILRVITWGMECGRPIKEILAVFRDLMPKRIASLEIPLSREIAMKKWPFVNLFLNLLENPLENREFEDYPGKYIVIEGNSGSGKETQARLLAEYLREQGGSVIVVDEPSELGKKILDSIKEGKRKTNQSITQSERSLIHAFDRVGIASEITSHLTSGETVIGVRSFLSSLAYQGEDPLKMAEVLFLNRFAPFPDLVLLLEVEAEEALRRIRCRHEENGVPIGDFEEPEKIKQISRRYDQAIGVIPGLPVERISANKPREEVFASIKQAIEKSELFR